MSAFLRIAWIVLRKDLTVEIRIYNKRGTAEQWIKEGKQAAHWTRRVIDSDANEVRLQLSVRAYNLAISGGGSCYHSGSTVGR